MNILSVTKKIETEEKKDDYENRTQTGKTNS
jgi:hypothetical protein